MTAHPVLVFRRRGEPTDAQLRAGNYRKRREPWMGLTIRVENEPGSVRSGVKPDGSRWETRMIYAYGYFERSEGVDGDEVDVFIGPHPDTAPMVYIVHQRKVGDWKNYDEDKCFVGFTSEDDARAAFLANYDDPRFLGPITAMPVPEFVEKVSATYERPSMIKALLFFAKAHVPMHMRHLRSGRVVIINPYDNRRHARDDRTLDLFSGARPPGGGAPAPKPAPAADGKARKFYVTMIRDPGPNQKVAWLAGPFGTHDEANGHVESARQAASKVDPFSDFDAFGTASFEADEGKHPPGKLNKILGIG